MPEYRVKQAADLLGVSDDTLRRWMEQGRLAATTSAGRQTVDGAELAALAHALAADVPRVGLVTNVIRDTVMAQVEMQCGPHRIVSLMSREAADDLGLEPGVRAIAAVKSTNVVVEVPDRA